MLEIAVFGKVSTGKSALLNAVFSTTAFIVDPRAGSTEAVQKVTTQLGVHKVVVIDTPGIGDIAGTERTEAALQAAQDAELVLIVCDKDLTESEYRLIKIVASFGKPLLAILNKADILNLVEREVLVEQICQRLSDFVDGHNVLLCAANPLNKEYIREKPDGTFFAWAEKVQPDVVRVRTRILEILNNEAETLRKVNQLAHQAETTVANVQSARSRALTIIDDYSIGVAVGVGLNPIPLLDLFGGTTAIIVLITKLAECYSITLSQDQIRTLATQIVTEGWKELWRAALPIIGGAILKSVPLIGWAIGALGQAVGAYYITYIIGQACSEYFAHNLHWIDSLQETLRQVIASTDRKNVTSRAAVLIKRRLEALGKR